MWVGYDVELHICPVLLFTPALETTLTWFDLTYALQVQPGSARWVRTALPEAGGLSEQPARLMAELAWIAQVRNEQIRRAMHARRTDRPRRRRRG